MELLVEEALTILKDPLSEKEQKGEDSEDFKYN